MRNVLVTINGGQGSDLGPNFSLTCDGGGVVTPNTATLSQLLAGKSVVVDDNATEVYVTATDGPCVGSPPLTLSISGIPTVTPTPTASATPSASSTPTPTSIDELSIDVSAVIFISDTTPCTPIDGTVQVLSNGTWNCSLLDGSSFNLSENGDIGNGFIQVTCKAANSGENDFGDILSFYMNGVLMASCTLRQYGIGQTCPTASPTSSPTASPTASPTSSPTASPTASPTPTVTGTPTL